MKTRTKKGWRQDRKLISLRQRWEVRYWANVVFGVTAARLREAVSEVGRSVPKVRAYMLTDKWAVPLE